jgi:hypothetical protein
MRLDALHALTLLAVHALVVVLVGREADRRRGYVQFHRLGSGGSPARDPCGAGATTVGACGSGGRIVTRVVRGGSGGGIGASFASHSSQSMNAA